MTNTETKSNIGQERIYLTYTPRLLSIIEEVRAETQAGRNHGRMLLSGLTHKVILSHAAPEHLPSAGGHPASTKNQVGPPQTRA